MLLTLIKGMYIAAVGNLFLAVLKRVLIEFLSKLGLDVSLSFKPNDKITFLTFGSMCVRCFSIRVACVILAPGKQSVLSRPVNQKLAEKAVNCKQG